MRYECRLKSISDNSLNVKRNSFGTRSELQIRENKS